MKDFRRFAILMLLAWPAQAYASYGLYIDFDFCCKPSPGSLGFCSSGGGPMLVNYVYCGKQCDSFKSGAYAYGLSMTASICGGSSLVASYSFHSASCEGSEESECSIAEAFLLSGPGGNGFIKNGFAGYDQYCREHGNACHSGHYGDLLSWFDDNSDHNASAMWRKQLPNGTWIIPYPDNPFVKPMESLYTVFAGRPQKSGKKKFATPLLELNGEPVTKAVSDYDNAKINPKDLKTEEDPPAGSKASVVPPPENNGVSITCSAEAPRSIPPSYSMNYNSVHGGQNESSAMKVERYRDGRVVFADVSNTRWTFRPYGDLADKGEFYYRPPLGASDRLVYGDIHGGRGYRVESPDGDVIEFTASSSSGTWLPSRYNAADGSWLTYEQGPNGLARITDMHGRYFAFERDASGLPVTVTDEQGRKTAFKYDAQGRATEVLHPDGYRKRFGYDAAGFMSSVKDGALAEERYTYDAQGRLLTSESDGGVNRLEHYYDDASSKTVITDAFGGRTTYVYKNEAGRKLTTGITDALGGQTALAYDGNYNIASATDQLGRTTRFVRNNNGDPEQITDALGATSTIQYQVKLKYRDAGGDKTDYYSRPVNITDALGRSTSLDYDSYGNLSKTVDALGNKTGMSYDKAGHMLELRDALGSTYKYEYTMGLARSVDPLGRVTRYKRDADLHVTQLTDPLGRNTTFTYDLSGNVTSVTNPMGHATKFAYGNGACPSCGGSQLSALTDPKGNTWAFNYDQYGRLTNTSNPLGQAKTYAYDKMSRVTEYKDPAGNVTGYAYDALNRLTKKDITTLTGVHSITDYTYDAVGNLLNIANGGNAVAYTYDALNRPVSTTQSFDGKAYRLDYAYDAVGNRTAMATPWGKYNYSYDALNRLTAIVNPANITVAFAYDAVGRRTSKKIFRTTPELLAEAEYEYDAAGQLLGITNKAGGKVVAFNKYQYDANGNRTRIEDQDGIWDYKYDAANRLTVALPWPVDYVKAEAFVYDKNGNRRYDKTAWDYHYDAANRLIESSTYTYTHDANGNLTSKSNRFDNSQTTYAYTPEQQLSDVTTPEHKIQYRYDSLGRRTARTVDGRTIKFIYDGQDIIAELDDNASPINIYTNGPGIDEPLIMTKADDKAYFYHADALGSIKAITDDSGKTIETYKYKAYGQPTILNVQGQTIPTSIIGNNRMFAAREYEPETGLYSNRRRYMDPSRGAFTQEDPIGFKSGEINFYMYAGSSPMFFADPSGLDIVIYLEALHPVVRVDNGTDSNGNPRYLYIQYGPISFQGSISNWIKATVPSLSVQGRVTISHSRDFPAPIMMPVLKVKTNKCTDKRIINNAEEIKDLADSGQYPYNLNPTSIFSLGSDSRNCWTFLIDLFR